MRNAFLSQVKRALTPQVEKTSSNFAGYYTIPIRYNGAPYNLPFIYFTSGQCSFDRFGSCIMCNFGRRKRVKDDLIISQVGQLIKSFCDRPAIYITPSGSMFDDVEVSNEVRLELFRLMKEAGYKAIKTETRPEFLTEQKLYQVRDVIGDQIDLEIGLGLESANEWVLKNCINKMLSLDSVRQAIELSHAYSALVYVHVLVNPPFLSEQEAIQDAIVTAEWAVANGADIIGLALTNVKPDTVTYWLANRGLYNVPNYWTLIKILLELSDTLRDRVGLFGFDSAVPIVYPMSNCSKCSAHLRSMLEAWCYTGDFRLIYEASHYPCACKTEWQAKLDYALPPLKQRVAKYYEYLAREIYSGDWWEKNKKWILHELNIPKNGDLK